MTVRKQEAGPLPREGFALATTLLIILVLGIIALGAAWLATTEHKTVHAESVHLRALTAADAGSEAAINFIRLVDDPPTITNFADRTVRQQGTTAIEGTNTYDYGMRFARKRPRPGWGVEYLDYDYAVTARGQASVQGQSGVQLVASRLFREGY